MATYPATVKNDPDEGIFVIEFPDFEEAIAAGRLEKDNPLDVGRRCLMDTIWFRLEGGRGIPAPSQLSSDQLPIPVANFTVNDNAAIENAVLDSFVKAVDESAKEIMRHGRHRIAEAVHSKQWRPRNSRISNIQEAHMAKVWDIVASLERHREEARSDGRNTVWPHF